MNTATEKTAIEKLLSAYGEALDAANAVKLISLFTQDGILMPNGAPSVKGQEQLKTAYETLFKSFQLNVTYSTDEVVVSGDYAYVRTNSKGNTIIHDKGETMPVNNKELFILHKENGKWKIANYIFNSNK